MTPIENITLRVIGALEACQISYFLSGSFASNYYGVPRSTKDADFVVELHGAVGTDFARQMGADFELDPQLSFETLTGTYRQILHHKRSPFKAELFIRSNDAHDQERFRRRRIVKHFEREIWMPSPEDVVVTKLRWARAKDKDDIRGVLAVQRGKLDWPYIENWCDQHGTRARLEKILKTVPEI
jgi:hypothetical protein